jgi:hypothetical protein
MSTSLLEERYRLALRLLPADYRAVWEEDMVETFLARAYAANPDDPELVELGRPSRAELLSIAGLALRLRLGGSDAPARPRLVGDALRLAGLIGLLYHCALVLSMFLITGWLAAGLPVPVPLDEVPPLPSTWVAVTGWLGLLWVIAFLIVLFGHSQLAWVPALAAFLADLVFIVLGTSGPLSYTTIATLLTGLATVAALSAFHFSAPAAPARPWLVALAIAAVAETATALGVPPTEDTLLLADWLTPWCVAVAVAAVVGWRRRIGGAWPLALALVAATLLLLRIGSGIDLVEVAADRHREATQLSTLLPQIALVAAAALVSAVRAVRVWRRLPPATIPSP